jgi:hypothetical protein
MQFLLFNETQAENGIRWKEAKKKKGKKKNKKKKNDLGTVPKFNFRIVEREKIDTIYMIVWYSSKTGVNVVVTIAIPLDYNMMLK